MKGDKREKIASAGGGTGGGGHNQHQEKSADETPQAAQRRQNQKEDPEQLEGIAQFKAGLGKGRDRYKRHIQHDLRHKQTGR